MSENGIKPLNVVVIGGVIIDMMRLTFNDAFLAYAALFAIEVILLVTAFVLTTRLDMQSSKAQMEAAQAPA